MPKRPVYKNLEVYQLSKKLAVACYELTHDLHKDEATNFIRYIRTASLNAHINIAQAAFAIPEKRKKYLKEARAAIIIIEAAVDILVEVGFAGEDQVEKVNFLASALIELVDSL